MMTRREAVTLALIITAILVGGWWAGHLQELHVVHEFIL